MYLFRMKICQNYLEIIGLPLSDYFYYHICEKYNCKTQYNTCPSFLPNGIFKFVSESIDIDISIEICFYFLLMRMVGSYNFSNIQNKCHCVRITQINKNMTYWLIQTIQQIYPMEHHGILELRFLRRSIRVRIGHFDLLGEKV